MMAMYILVKSQMCWPVKYDGKVYPGEVTDVLAYEIIISAIHCSGKHFKWPERKDEVAYKCENVASKIEPLTVAGSRGQVSFKYFEQNKVYLT